MKIGSRIKKLREEQSLTQEELAIAVHTTKQTIYKYENGIVTNIPSEKIEKLATALNTTPSYLMGWADDPMNEIYENFNQDGVSIDRLEELGKLYMKLQETTDKAESEKILLRIKRIEKVMDKASGKTTKELPIDELSEYLEDLRYRPEMRMLFSAAKTATKEDIEKAVKIIETLKGE